MKDDTTALSNMSNLICQINGCTASPIPLQDRCLDHAARGEVQESLDALAARLAELTEERDWLKVELDRLGRQMASQSARHATGG